MLKFTRNFGQCFIIGDDVEVRVLGWYQDGIRIGVTAPKDISVDRKEVRDRKNRDKQSEVSDD